MPADFAHCDAVEFGHGLLPVDRSDDLRVVDELEPARIRRGGRYLRRGDLLGQGQPDPVDTPPLASPELLVVLAGLTEGDVVGATHIAVGVSVISTVVLPPADGADLVIALHTDCQVPADDAG